MISNGNYPTWEECERQYPRLIRAMCYVAILSTGEAATALRDYIFNRDNGGHVNQGGGEAVRHYGGPLRTIRQAIVCRHHQR